MSIMPSRAMKIQLCLLVPLVGASLAPALSKETYDHGFRVYGLRYPDVNYPMSKTEVQIFNVISDSLDRLIKSDSELKDQMPHGVTRDIIKSVSLNFERNGLLINLDTNVVQRRYPIRMEVLTRYLSISAIDAAKRATGHEIAGVIFVHNGARLEYQQRAPGLKLN